MSHDTSSRDVKQKKIVLYGVPTYAFEATLRSRLPSNTEIQLLPYEASLEEKHEAFRTMEVLVANRVDSNVIIPDTLKLIQLPGAGADEIDFTFVPPAVPVCNVYEHQEGVAEYVLLSMLLHTGPDIIGTDQDFRTGSWARSGRLGAPPAGEIFGQTVGIVGLGRIGQAIGRRAKSFGMKVIGANRSVHSAPNDYIDEFFQLASLQEMLPKCNTVVVCCSLTDETTGLISSQEFSYMKQDSYLINVARGPVVEEAALFSALESKEIGGANVDVWYQYPDGPGHHPEPSKFAFASLSNLYMTPHIAGWTTGTIIRRGDFVVENISNALNGGSLRNRIN